MDNRIGRKRREVVPVHPSRLEKKQNGTIKPTGLLSLYRKRSVKRKTPSIVKLYYLLPATRPGLTADRVRLSLSGFLSKLPVAIPAGGAGADACPMVLRLFIPLAPSDSTLSS
jgi:hypothetical protein